MVPVQEDQATCLQDTVAFTNWNLPCALESWPCFGSWDTVEKPMHQIFDCAMRQALPAQAIQTLRWSY